MNAPANGKGEAFGPRFRAFGIEPLRVSPVPASIAFAVRRWLRRCGRNPYIGDLRLIKLEHRASYRAVAKRHHDCGTMIGLLLLAYDRGHLRSQVAQ